MIRSCQGLFGLLIFCLVATVHSQANSGHLSRECLASALQRNHEQLEANRFNVVRGALQYVAVFGRRFVQDLESLPEESHWLDAGAGKGNAIREFAEGVENRVLGTSYRVNSRHITALGYAKPPGALESIPGRDFRYLSGKYLEDYSFEEIGACDLITDVMGPFSYTARIDLVLRAYLALLKIGGKLYIDAAPRGVQFTEGGRTLLGYLSGIPGISAEVQSNGGFIRIEKTGWTRAEDVPPLELKKFVPDSPPSRWY